MPPSGETKSVDLSRAVFASTHWSVVLTVRERESRAAEAALERLCRAYWPPVYGFLRRKGHGPEDAKDLTQEFFALFLRREAFADADPHRGRFRSFLRKALDCFLVDEHRRTTRQKRGGGQPLLSLADHELEEGYLEPAAPELGPGETFDRRWRLALLQQALRRLEAEFAAAEKQRQFTLLKEFLTAPAQVGAYEPIAAQLGTSARTVAVTIHRMRQRYRELVREELAHTVTDAAEYQEELRFLFS